MLCSNLAGVDRMPTLLLGQTQVTEIVLLVHSAIHSVVEDFHHTIIGRVSIVASWRDVARISEQVVVLLLLPPQKAAHMQNP